MLGLEGKPKKQMANAVQGTVHVFFLDLYYNIYYRRTQATRKQ